jgi:hypothetical protein
MQSFESINQLKFPPQVAARFQELRQRQSEGKLSPNEERELDLLTQAEESLALLRAKARTLLDSKSPSANQPIQTIRNGLPVMQVPAGTPTIDPVAVRRFLEEEAF